MRRLIVLLAALAGTFAITAPVGAASISAVTSVNVVKPVKLTKIQDIDFGTLTFAELTANRTISVSQLGVLTCATEIVCSGVARQARFNLTGTKKLTVLITYSGGTLTNGTDSIPFTADGPASITVANSGAPGNDFDVGGSLDISPTLEGGVYTGTMTVTAEYQ